MVFPFFSLDSSIFRWLPAIFSRTGVRELVAAQRAAVEGRSAGAVMNTRCVLDYMMDSYSVSSR